MALAFGTAGLRGPLQDGPDGMNVATVTRATAGLAAWLTAHGHAGQTVVVGRDGRHGSPEFFAATTEVLAAAGFAVLALPDPGPTPLVAFACRRLGAAAGVMITASHNPPQDNGYKVYLDGGAQLIGPADREIEACITAAPDAAAVPRTTVPSDPRAAAVRDDYLSRLDERFGAPVAGGIRVALTAMHGVGGALAVDALHRSGISDVVVVDEQFTPDPDFPTVAFPNPEEPGATDLLLALAAESDADLAIALDPDADRCAAGVRDGDGSWRMLTGDETGALLGNAVLDEHDPAADPRPVVASSIVSGTLMDRLATVRGADARRTLTGFKWLVRAGEPLVYAYEEALGHCVDPEAVRDKDGISAAVALARLACRCAAAGRTLGDALEDLMSRYGRHVTAQRAIRVDDTARIAAIMAGLRAEPPAAIAGIPVTLHDYLDAADGLRTDAVELTGSSGEMNLRIVARPSGTEPKLKYYGQCSEEPGAAPADLPGLLARALAELPDGVTRRNA
ncbi:MAG: phospho-sugar mutase [Gordonia sp. (in: high G+C Gram-positive bacteria)]|uniref:phospho-sugar mutase n=1 Tax=Gordonia sp. (in: high G+C Gram-positive bacteria) TaxID=84139 RepID=UPI0039E632DC